jgi:PhnB protein
MAKGDVIVMAVKPVPEGYHTATPYLIVNGVAKVIDFLQQTFGAVETQERTMRPDGAVMHAEVRIGDSRIMFGEPMGQYQPMPSSIYIYIPDVDAAYQRAIKAGATSLMEPANQFYGDRNAGVRDSAGNMWWIAVHVEDVSPEELARRAAAMAGKAHG